MRITHAMDHMPAPTHAALVERMPFRLFREAYVRRHPARGHNIHLGVPTAFFPTAPDRESWKSITFLVHDPHYIRHYFHFVEMFLALYAFHRTYLPSATVRRIVFTIRNWTSPIENDTQQELLSAVYPNAEVLTPANTDDAELEHVVLVDRSLAMTAIGKFLEPVLPIAGGSTRALAQEITRQVSGMPKPPPPPGEMPRALYVKRNPPRCLAGPLEAQLLDALRRGGLQVDMIDYAELPWREQVRRTAACDLLVGVHGNGLTNLLWLPPHAVVLELFPAGAHHYDYQILAELKRHAYFGLEGRSGGYVFREFSRHGDAYGRGPDNDREVVDLSWLAVARVIETTHRM